MQKLAYYPGCSLHGPGAKEYDLSVKAVFKTLGVELVEVPDFVCCGASSAHSVDHLLGLAIPAANLIFPEQQGLDMLAPCAACWQRFIWVNHEIKNDPEMKKKIGQAIEYDLQGTSRIYSPLDAIAEIGYDKVKEAVKRPLNGLKVASYTGCYFVKPNEIAVDDAENPQILDNIMAALGAEVVDWPYKTECCGASIIFYDPDASFKSCRRIIEIAQKAGADCMATACPMCHMNLDMRQAQINSKFGTKLNMPINYITELMAYAFGFEPGAIRMDKHFVDALGVLKKIG